MPPCWVRYICLSGHTRSGSPVDIHRLALRGGYDHCRIIIERPDGQRCDVACPALSSMHTRTSTCERCCFPLPLSFLRLHAHTTCGQGLRWMTPVRICHPGAHLARCWRAVTLLCHHPAHDACGRLEAGLGSSTQILQVLVIKYKYKYIKYWHIKYKYKYQYLTPTLPWRWPEQCSSLSRERCRGRAGSRYQTQRYNRWSSSLPLCHHLAAVLLSGVIKFPVQWCH